MAQARQYGTPKSPQAQARKPAAGYSEIPAAQTPVKKQDPSPAAEVVIAFHKNVPVDTRPEDIHHRLGPGPNEAASGRHTHNGADSPLLLDGVTLTGSKGGNVALASVIQALVKLGAKDSTT